MLTKCLNTSESIKMGWRKRHREIEDDSSPNCKNKRRAGRREVTGERTEGLQSGDTPSGIRETLGL
jgi:hypothetical protein